MPSNDAAEIESLKRMIELQARVCYMNVDRTLATWTRTALSLIFLGTVIDRFGVLLLRNHPPHIGTWLAPNPLSNVGGIALVAFGTVLSIAVAIRHEAYRAAWERAYGRNTHGPWMAFGFATMVAVFGTIVLVLLLVFVK